MSLLEKIPQFILATCILHNFLLKKATEEEDDRGFVRENNPEQVYNEVDEDLNNIIKYYESLPRSHMYIYRVIHNLWA